MTSFGPEFPPSNALTGSLTDGAAPDHGDWTGSFGLPPSSTVVLASGDTTGATDPVVVNAALAASAASLGKYEVKLIGQFYVNAPFIVPGRARLDGYGATVKPVNGANLDAVVASPAALTTTASQNYDAPLSIRGMFIDGNRANQTAGAGNGILVSAGASVTGGGQTTIQDNLVREVRSAGICLSEVNLGGFGLVAGTAAPYTGEARIANNRVYNAGSVGIWQRGGGLGGPAAMTDGFMVNNVVGYTTHDGIRVDSAGGWLINGNHPYGTGLSGILVQGTFSTRIEDNYIEGVGVLDSLATHFSSSSAFSQATTYAAGTTYGLNDVVIYAGAIWRSKVDANVGNQPDISTAQWAGYVGGLQVSAIACLSSNSARPVTIAKNQISLGHNSWVLNSNFAYNGIYVQGPATGTSKAPAYVFNNDIANELQPAGTNTTTIKYSGAGAGPSGVNPFERDNGSRGSWTTSRTASSTCSPVGAVGSGASGGTGASATVTGSNTCGNVAVTAGNSGLTSGALVSVSYVSTLAPQPRVIIQPRNAATAALGPFNVTANTSGFTINGSVAPTSGASYSFDYIVMISA